MNDFFGASEDDLDQGLCKEEKILRMLDAQVELIPGLDGYRRIPSFRACLLHKLGTIYKAWFSWTKASERCGIRVDTMKNWRMGRNIPSITHQKKIDEEYEYAIERLRHHATLRELRIKGKIEKTGLPRRNSIDSDPESDMNLSAKRVIEPNRISENPLK